MIRKKERLGIHKLHLPSKSIEFCGRNISKDSWSFSANHFEKILALKRPQKKAQLVQVVHICNLLSPQFPNFAVLRDKFAVEVEMSKNSKRLARENEDVNWTPQLVEAWETLKSGLETAAKQNLASYRRHQPIIIFTDASKDY